MQGKRHSEMCKPSQKPPDATAKRKRRSWGQVREGAAVYIVGGDRTCDFAARPLGEHVLLGFEPSGEGEGRGKSALRTDCAMTQGMVSMATAVSG